MVKYYFLSLIVLSGGVALQAMSGAHFRGYQLVSSTRDSSGYKKPFENAIVSGQSCNFEDLVSIADKSELNPLLLELKKYSQEHEASCRASAERLNWFPKNDKLVFVSDAATVTGGLATLGGIVCMAMTEGSPTSVLVFATSLFATFCSGSMRVYLSEEKRCLLEIAQAQKDIQNLIDAEMGGSTAENV